VANHRRFIHLQENSVTHNSGAQTNGPERTCQSNQLAKIDWESLLRDTKRDKDLRASGEQPFKPAASIIFLAFWTVSRDSLRHFRWPANC
jgi:hypothetical protein